MRRSCWTKYRGPKVRRPREGGEYWRSSSRPNPRARGGPQKVWGPELGTWFFWCLLLLVVIYFPSNADVHCIPTTRLHWFALTGFANLGGNRSEV